MARAAGLPAQPTPPAPGPCGPLDPAFEALPCRDPVAPACARLHSGQAGRPEGDPTRSVSVGLAHWLGPHSCHSCNSCHSWPIRRDHADIRIDDRPVVVEGRIGGLEAGWLPADLAAHQHSLASSQDPGQRIYWSQHPSGGRSIAQRAPEHVDPEEQRSAIALFRYTLILPLLRDEFEPGGKGRLRQQIAAGYHEIPHSARRSVSVPTLARWERQYKQDGFDGLKPKPRDGPGKAGAKGRCFAQDRVQGRGTLLLFPLVLPEQAKQLPE